MVDNIKSIRKILKFDKFGEFYYISIMQRNKDGVKVASSHDNCRRIRTFYVFSLEEFDKIVPFIKEICDKINARCYIELNRKDIFIIGGESIYKQLLRYCDKVYITEVNIDCDADTYFPSLGSEFLLDSKSEVKQENNISYVF